MFPETTDVPLLRECEAVPGVTKAPRSDCTGFAPGRGDRVRAPRVGRGGGRALKRVVEQRRLHGPHRKGRSRRGRARSHRRSLPAALAGSPAPSPRSSSCDRRSRGHRRARPVQRRRGCCGAGAISAPLVSGVLPRCTDCREGVLGFHGKRTPVSSRSGRFGRSVCCRSGFTAHM